MGRANAKVASMARIVAKNLMLLVKIIYEFQVKRFLCGRNMNGTLAIIKHGLYIFYTIFSKSDVPMQKWLQWPGL